MDRRFRVLLIEDDEDDFVFIKDLLRETSFPKFDLDWVGTYDLGVESIDRAEHDAILLDYRLGERNGLELLREVVANGCLAPVIFLTAQGDYMVDEEAMAAGAADYLTKGQISSDLLEHSICYSISRKRAELELKKYRDYLEELVRERTEQLESVNHDLRMEIYERERAEEALRDSEEHFRSLFERNPAVLLLIDPESGAIVNASEAAAKFYGFSRTELCAMNISEINQLPPEQIADVRKSIKKEELKHFVFSHRLRNGKIRTVEVYSSPFEMGDQTVLFSVVHDITEQQLAEQALRDSERQLQSIIQGYPIPAMVGGKDHRVVYWNRAWEELSQVPSVDMVDTRQHWKVFYDNERPCLADLLVDEVSYEEILQWYDGKCSKSGLLEEAYEATVFFPRLGREGKWLHLTAALVRNSLGVTVGAIETIEDITERKLAVEKLQRSEEKFSKAFWASPASVSLSSLKAQCYIDVNESFLKNSGYRRDEIIGRSSLEVGLWGQDVRDRFLGILNKEGKVRDLEFQFRNKSGVLMTTSLSAESIEIEDEPCVLVIANDITERKRAEEELRESRQKLSDIINFLPDATLVIDRDGKVIAWNKALEEMTGVEAADMLGKGNYEYALPFYGERRPILIDLVLKRREKYEKRYMGMERRDSGLLGEAYMPALRGGEVYLFGTASSLRDLKGNIYGAIESIRDVTRRRRSEEALVRSQKELSIQHKIAQIFLEKPDDEMFEAVLNEVLAIFESKYGLFGYLDESMNLHTPSMSTQVYDQCLVSGKDLMFPHDAWGGIWGASLETGESCWKNEPGTVPEGHIPIERALSVPIVHSGKSIGLIAVANKQTDYAEPEMPQVFPPFFMQGSSATKSKENASPWKSGSARRRKWKPSGQWPVELPMTSTTSWPGSWDIPR
jgi:PAS domain S-box-containing protein